MRPRKLQRNLPACVYHRHGAYWYVKKGKWLRLGADLRVALERYAKLADGPKGEMPDLIDKVLDHVRPTLAKSSAEQYDMLGARLKKMLCEFSPAQVRPKDVAAVKLALAKTPNTANRTLSVLSIVFKHAVEWQIVDSNPCLGIMRFKEAKRDRYITDDEFARIRSHATPKLRVLIDLAYYTAQRIGDVIMIRHSDVTKEGVQFKQKKTGTKLTVLWSPGLRAATAAAKALEGKVATMTIMASRKRKPLDYKTMQELFQAACKAAGVENVHLHDIRAKALTDAKRQGLNATALAGHKNESMTDRYIRQFDSPTVQGPSFGQSMDVAEKTS